MSSARSTIRVLAALLPLGAFGMSTALAAAPGKPFVAAADDNSASPSVTSASVATRLKAIRTATSQAVSEQAGLQPGDPNIQKAWWGNWHGGGWGWHGGWGNGGWHNWHNGWGNGGWGNGGWHNWHNGWGNGGWHNFWRNW
jgi:rSAM-associated Gly-rich repeat protein